VPTGGGVTVVLDPTGRPLDSSAVLESCQLPAAPTAHRFGRIEIRPAQRQVLVDGQVVAVAARAYDVLWALVEHRDRVITKNELLDLVWPGVVVEENNLHTQVSSLRKQIGAAAIATIPGRGYRFVAVESGHDAGPTARDAAPQAAPRVGTPSPADALPTTTGTFSLIGREADLEALDALLATSRVLSIWGPGGVGKTTVARRIFERALADGREAAWVELGSVTDPARITDAIAASLTLGDKVDTTLAGLGRVLAQRRTLVVLDNCEHLVADVARVVHELLAASKSVRFVATTREPLKLHDEQRYVLEGLACPPADASLMHAREEAALRLLEQRAKLADSRFALDSSNIASAIELCRALDGNPLAIEMAASRVRLFGLAGVAGRLAERLRFLGSDTRDTLARHGSLRATLAWSCSLLSESAQRALRRLSVFAGTFSIEAGERLLLMDGSAQQDALDAIAELVDKSLLTQARGAVPRLHLVETTRLFAAERLSEAGEQVVTLEQHVQVMRAIGEHADAAYAMLADDAWLSRHANDLPDLLAAFERACRLGHADAATALGIALRPHLHVRSLHAQTRHVAEQLLDLLPQAGPLAQARTWSFVSSTIVVSIRGVTRLEACRRCFALWQTLGDERFMYEALCWLAHELAANGDVGQAQAELENARRLSKADWPARRRLRLAREEASLAKHRGDRSELVAKLHAALRLAIEAGDVYWMSSCHARLADAALSAGQLDEALAHCDACANVHAAHGGVPSVPSAMVECTVRTLHSDFAGAARAGLHAQQQAAEMDITAGASHAIALLAARAGQGDEAAQLLGAYDAWTASNRFSRDASELELLGLTESAIEAAIGRARHQEQRSFGAALEPEDVHALALGVLRPLASLTPAAP
jgi:predicted ATPase/DNA-binding winged helix-turn-helix (wHTH) protein